MSPSVSFRQSIRWSPGDASEPTHTVVLTGDKTGVFLDVRFSTDITNELDWAFAGYRSSIGSNTVKFEHHFDSRTLNALDVIDQGTNTTLPDGTTLEVGEMVNPESGKMTGYEEIWRDEDIESGTKGLFIKNKSGTVWRAYVGHWQLAMGRTREGVVWAWQARHVEEGPGFEGAWKVLYCTNTEERNSAVTFLPDGVEWAEGAPVTWDEDEWLVLENT